MRRKAFSIITKTFFSLQGLRLIPFSLAGFNSFLPSNRFVLVIVLLQELTVFFLQIAVFLLRAWVSVIQGNFLIVSLGNIISGHPLHSDSRPKLLIKDLTSFAISNNVAIIFFCFQIPFTARNNYIRK